MNQHSLKAGNAYSAFSRHFNKTQDPEARATMLDFYNRLFTSEFVKALMHTGTPELSTSEKEDLVRMRESIKVMLKKEAARNATRSSGVVFKPIVAVNASRLSKASNDD